MCSCRDEDLGQGREELEVFFFFFFFYPPFSVVPVASVKIEAKERGLFLFFSFLPPSRLGRKDSFFFLPPFP